jgi:hypothetical protein
MLGSIFAGILSGPSNQTGGSGVISFNGRTGAVMPANGDYTADSITETPTREFVTPAQKITWDNKQDSFNGRTGAVMPANGDYTADLITETATREFVTPGQKITWNSKQNALSFTELPTQIGTGKILTAGSTSLQAALLNSIGNGINALLFLQGSIGNITVTANGGSINAPFTSATFGGEVTALSFFGIRNKSYIGSNVDGNIILTNQSTNDFNMLILGRVAAGFPAFKKSGTLIQVRLADDSGYGNFDAGAYRVGGVAGVSGSFLSNDGKTVTVTNGIITNIA